MRHTILKKSIKGALIMGGLCALIPSVYGQGIGMKKLDEMLTPSADKIARGKVVYQRQCVTCHGQTGANDTEWAREHGMEQGGFTNDTFVLGGGLIQTYNVISKKQEGVEHPVYDAYVAYQDRWAVAHYVRSLSSASPSDPAAVIAQAEFEAKNGVCNEEIKGSISARVAPKGEEQLTKGAELYKSNCVSCHGEAGKGDGAAAAALQPPPRNFTDANANWTNGTSPLAIFGTLTNGIAGTSMASYANLTEDERWSLVHYVRNWIPEQKRQDSTDDQILDVCRSLSAPPKPAAIPIESAMKFLVADAPNARLLSRSKLGPVYRYSDANAEQGAVLYGQNCASCHGNQGDGARPAGPYGAVPPFLYLSVAPLQNVDASGSHDAFAQRASQGVHDTLPDMSGAALMSQQDWKDLQAYVALFKGDAQFMEATQAASQAAAMDGPAIMVPVTLQADNTFMVEGETLTLQQLKERADTALSETGERVSYTLTPAAGVTPEAVNQARQNAKSVSVTFQPEAAVEAVSTPEQAPSPEAPTAPTEAPTAPQ